MKDVEHLNIYFEDAMDKISCEDVLDIWKNDTSLTNISNLLKDEFVEWLKNSEWRNKHLPSKNRFYDMVKKNYTT